MSRFPALGRWGVIFSAFMGNLLNVILYDAQRLVLSILRHII